MIPPNEDNRGRLHAPCNGYKIPQVKLDFCDFNYCYDEKLFSKGEFLPIPINDEFSWCGNTSSNDFSFKGRILVKNDMILALQNIKDENKPFKVGVGATWNKGDDTFGYAYISSCWKSVVDVFKDKLIEVEKVENEKPKGDAPIGVKITVKAKVIGIPLRYDLYDNPVLKLMIEFENGSTAFGSLPKKISDVSIGQTIEFKATFSKSNSSSHAFYKSPSASKIIYNENELEALEEITN